MTTLQTTTTTADCATLLRQAWMGAADLAQEHNIPGLHSVIEARMARVSPAQMDEKALLAMAAEFRRMVASVGTTPSTLREVGRRLNWGVYECLLAQDASAELHLTVAPMGIRFAAIDAATLGSTIDEQLSAGRFHDAAVTITRISRSQGGADIAAIACRAGVACRSAGHGADAAACFQASCVADPDFAAAASRQLQAA